ncbi:hypothetical protein BHE74_00046668 [Ensete ventricosum]|nr:hypothetical protein GW17_00032056 [Ensete ventricosum]RWW47352.1 hypothetical protein BHE74_00046668 [Ensete ventricosum]
MDVGVVINQLSSANDDLRVKVRKLEGGSALVATVGATARATMLVDQLELALQQLEDTERELEGAKRKLGEAKHGREEVAPHLGDAKWKLCEAEQGCE